MLSDPLGLFDEPDEEPIGETPPEPRPAVPACITCGGTCLVFDAAGVYCTYCRSRPGQPATPDAEPESSALPRVTVGWGEKHAGVSWISIRNPVGDEVAEIRAQGLNDKDKWLHARLPMNRNKGHRLNLEPSPEDTWRAETDRKVRELQRQEWDSEAILRMKKVAATMACALCRQPVSVDFITGLCPECSEK